MNPNHTDITLVIDRSGSMGRVRQDTIHGINTFIADQKTGAGTATITAYKFDDVYETLIATTDIKNAQPLTEASYVPRGSTALLDAMGRAITETGKRLSETPESGRAGKVVFVTVTDGEENASREYTRARIFDMIKHQREAYKWEFVFLGAGPDAINEARSFGMPVANAMNYAHNSVGVMASYDTTSFNLKQFRCGAKAGMSFEPDDYKKQDDAGALHNPKP
jgi:hypothetical protein